MNYTALKNISYECLLDLSSEEGIHASSITEAYGCVFGRDSALTILKLLNVYQKKHDPVLLDVCKRGLRTLISLQGKEENPESGEEPGKIIHEFRKDRYERLINRPRPWYVYPDKMLRNYDSLDSTPLTLIALYRYWKLTRDEQFLAAALPVVDKGLQWMMFWGDKDQDGFLEYEFASTRVHGGLEVQSWTDSAASLTQADGRFPLYPIAPIEVQAYAWLCYRMWGCFYEQREPEKAQKLIEKAHAMKLRFNTHFIIKESDSAYGVQALDGRKQQITTITGNPLLCLWATFTEGRLPESIIDSEFIPAWVTRAFASDLFDPAAGIRTMSNLSKTYDGTVSSYHNGSFWPILNGLIHEGLASWGFEKEADALKQAALAPIAYFQCPIELYIKHTENYEEFVSRFGKKGCRFQAWTAAAVLDLVT